MATAFWSLAPDDQEYVRQCVFYAADLLAAHGRTTFDHIRYGVALDDLLALRQNWPDFDDSDNNSLVVEILNNCMNEVLHGWSIDPLEWNRNFTVTPQRVELAFRRWRDLHGWMSPEEQDIEWLVYYTQQAQQAWERRALARTEGDTNTQKAAELCWVLTLHGLQDHLMYVHRYPEFRFAVAGISDLLRTLRRAEVEQADRPPPSPPLYSYIGGLEKWRDEAKEDVLRDALDQMLRDVEVFRALPESPARHDLRIRLLLQDMRITALRQQEMPPGTNIAGENLA